MNRLKKTASAVAATALASGATLLVQAADAAPAQAAAPADAAFVVANQQSNLAEISLGHLAGSRAQDAATHAIATKTLSDHLTAKAKLTAAAKKAGASVPDSPNQMQLSVAAALKSAPAGSFDLMYAQAQVTAHEQALAGARQELDSTSNAGLRTYTKYYIGIASMHLRMAQDEVRALGGRATTVPAGTGGAAATNVTSATERDLGIGAGALLIVVGLGAAVRRRRYPQQ
ncbi:DUF4142 domain-containing protein [uncultured Jatrophihabitans sp.]|uniref:DUF4142 domain-containing protein n=1 Tax=uncultured Jatrophihabitans sp. TaxID=1610747 RepID=UPI0035CC1BC8